MRMFAVAALAAFSSAQDPSTPGFVDPTVAFETFRAERGGDWVVQWHAATGTPSAIYGTGLPIAGWSDNSLPHARRHAEQLLVEHRELLGLGTSDFRESIGARMGRTWSFKFDQQFRGLPVIGGRADVRINMSGVVAMLGSRAWPIPATFDVGPAIAEEVALAVAWATLDEQPSRAPQPAPVARPRLVIWGDAHAPVLAPVFLCWEVAVSNVDRDGIGTIGRYYVDAKTGAVHHFENDRHECGLPGCTPATHDANVAAAALPPPAVPPVPTTVTVMGWTRTGNDAWSPLTNVPLPGVALSVPGVGNFVTDANGEFTIDIAAPVNVAIGALDGRHHAVIAGADAPSANVTVNPGVATTIQLLTSAATVNQAAHTTMTWWVDRTNEFARSILGNSAELATISGIVPTVNITNTCNAYYTNNTINFYQQGGNCANTAFSTVIAHEWGHGLDHRYGGIANTAAEGVSEGWGDILGMYLVDSPLLGSGFQSPNQPLRDGNNTRMYPYSTTSPHGAGQVWMGFAWKLRQRLRAALPQQQAIDLSNEIVIGSIVADATTRVDAVREVFVADDDDGNLLNGTPHYVHLSGAAIDKGIPYPQIQLASIAHVPLLSTTERLTPRLVVATVAPFSGTINQVRLHFDAGSGAVVRTMHPNGGPNGYRAMLPGLTVGTVSYHIEATHSTGAIVRLPASGEITYSVDGATAGFFSANFDSGSAGWTNGTLAGQNDWQVGDPAGKSGSSNGVSWADPQTAASAPNCYGNDLGNTIGTQAWNGAYQGNVLNYLRSPVIDCSGRTGVKLRFKRWLTVEEALYDQASIRVNGTVVWQNPTNGNLLDTSWVTVEYPLPMADNNPSVQIEWRLDTDGSLHLGGWNIDDVQLLESIPVAVDAELRMLPEQAVQGAPMTLTVTTPGNSRPYLLALADQPGPTLVPGFPTMAVGGNIGLFGGTTDASGSAVVAFVAPSVPSALGVLYFSQVLTVNAAFTEFVASNAHVNLFTLTP